MVPNTKYSFGGSRRRRPQVMVYPRRGVRRKYWSLIRLKICLEIKVLPLVAERELPLQKCLGMSDFTLCFGHGKWLRSRREKSGKRQLISGPAGLTRTEPETDPKRSELPFSEVRSRS